MNDNEKLQAFANEALSDASNTARELHAETERKKEELLATAKKKITAAANAALSQRMTDFRREQANYASRRSLESRRDFLLHREGIMQRTFDEAKRLLREFAAGEDYPEWLLKKAVEAAEEGYFSYVVYVSSRDSHLTQDICDAMKNARHGEITVRVETDAEIQLGGARFHCDNEGIVINKTLDSALEDRKSSFMLTLGKSIAGGGEV